MRVAFEVTATQRNKKEIEDWRLIKCKLLRVSLPINIIPPPTLGFNSIPGFCSFFLTHNAIVSDSNNKKKKRYRDTLEGTASDYFGIIT